MGSLGCVVVRLVADTSAGPRVQPLLVLFPHDSDRNDDFKALGSLREVLRDRGFQVVTYDPAAPLIVRLAKDKNHPEWVSGAPLDDTQRAALAGAIGADAWVDVQAGGRRHAAVVTVTTIALPPRVVQLTGTNDYDADSLQKMSLGLPAPPPGVVLEASPPVEVIPSGPPSPLSVAVPPIVSVAPGPSATPAPSVTPSPPSVSVAPIAPPTPTPQIPSPAPGPLVTTPSVPIPIPANAGAPPITSATPAPLLSNPRAAEPAPSSPPVVLTTTAPPVSAAAPQSSAPPPPSSGGVEASIPSPSPVAATPEDDPLKGVQPLIDRGDHALDQSEVAQAIALYRQAVDGAPRSAVPRLRLAKAYLQGGFQDRAVDEAKRALDIVPNDVAVQEFLIQLDGQNGTATGAVTLYQALVSKSPSDVGGHVGLGDAYWNAGNLEQAEAEYKQGEGLSAPEDKRAITRLARLYAAQARYDDVVAALSRMGQAASYPLAVRIIQSRTDALMSQLSQARETFDDRKISHEQLYDTAKTVSAQAKALAGMIDQITPPASYHIAYLDRALAVNLVAQEADVIRNFVESSDASQEDRAVKLEKAAQSQVLTAHAAEEKAGLHLAND